MNIIFILFFGSIAIVTLIIIGILVNRVQARKEIQSIPEVIKKPKNIDIPIDADYEVIPDANKKCPYCAEEIKAEATVCKHCGKEFNIIKTNNALNFWLILWIIGISIACIGGALQIWGGINLMKLFW